MAAFVISRKGVRGERGRAYEEVTQMSMFGRVIWFTFAVVESPFEVGAAEALSGDCN